MYGGPRVTFHPAGTAVDVPVGSTVLDAAGAAQIALSVPCGGRGRCGRCAVKVIAGELAPPDSHEAAVLARVGDDSGAVRLACRARVISSVELQPLVPSSAFLRAGTSETSSVESLGQDVYVAVAVDLGTTSVAVRLLDPSSGRVLADGRSVNRQTSWGADILSRITAALSGEADALYEAAFDSVNEALSSALASAGILRSRIGTVVIAANPAMASLLGRVDVSGLATHPFDSALHVIDEPALARALGAEVVIVVPPVGGFVGGDLVAGLLGEGLAEGGEGVLYVDAGTNAEVALVLPERVVVASAPAGPAFEGWGIACGGAAGTGGVTRVGLHGAELLIESEGTDPTHLTGSGLLSAVAVLRSSGHVSPDGLLRPDGPLADRMFERDGIRAVTLCSDPADRSLFITQLDIREFQSAKAAVATAIKAVIGAGSGGVQLSRVIISGAFGGALAEKDLVALGVVPANAAGLTVMAGDAVLKGAAWMALDPAGLESARTLVARAENVDLAAAEGFSASFMESLELVPFHV